MLLRIAIEHKDHKEEQENLDKHPEEYKAYSDTVASPPASANQQPQQPTLAPLPMAERKEMVVVPYWTDWTSAPMPPEAIPFDKVTHVNYAFSAVGFEYYPTFQTDYLLNRVVRSAHLKGVKVLISIGRWTGSQYFSPLSASPRGGQTFVNGAIDFVRSYNLVRILTLFLRVSFLASVLFLLFIQSTL